MAVLNEEQSMLRDMAKSWAQEKSPVSELRKVRDTKAELGYDVAAWNFPAMNSLMMLACSIWLMLTSKPTSFHIDWMIWTT